MRGNALLFFSCVKKERKYIAMKTNKVLMASGIALLAIGATMGTVLASRHALLVSRTAATQKTITFDEGHYNPFPGNNNYGEFYVYPNDADPVEFWCGTYCDDWLEAYFGNGADGFFIRTLGSATPTSTTDTFELRFRIGLNNITSFSFTYGNLSADTSISLYVGVYSWNEVGQYYDCVDNTKYNNQLTGIDSATFSRDVLAQNYEKKIDLLEVEIMLNNYEGITGLQGCYLESLTVNWAC